MAEPAQYIECSECHQGAFCTRGDDGPHTIFHSHNGSRYCYIEDDPDYGPGAAAAEGARGKQR